MTNIVASLWAKNSAKPRRCDVVALAKPEKEAEIYLYDVIGDAFFGVDPAQFVRDLKAIEAETIHLRVNSPGGDVNGARAIMTAIAQHPARVIAHIDGIAASAASFLVMGANEIEMSAGSFLMVHNARAVAWGTAEDHRDVAQLLDQYSDGLADAYAKRCKQPKETVQGWMDAETWFAAEAAVEAGLADRVVETVAVENEWDLSVYAKVPDGLRPGAGLRVAAVASPPVATDDVPGSAPDGKEGASMVPNLEQTGQQNAAPNVDQIQAQARAAEQTRCAEILAIATRHGLGDEFTQRHVTAGTNIEAVRAAALDVLAQRSEASAAVRPVSAAATVTVDAADKRRDAMSDAVLNRIEPAKYKVDAQNNYRGMSCLRMAEEMLRASGERIESLVPAELAVQAMHSSSDFPYVLENSARKRLLDAYTLATPTYRLWCAPSTSPDFKTMSVARLGEAPVFEKVAEGAEIKLGTMAESREQYALGTYGKGISFTRQMLINDDLSAFNRIVFAFGQQAARLENSTAYAILTANAAMSDGVALFYASHGNLGSGAIANTGLDSMFVAMGIQTGVDGSTILNLTPRFLIVPKTKEATARTAMKETNEAVSASNQNMFAGRLEVVADGVLDGTSTTVWYGAADPAIAPGVEYCHLEGASGPQIIRKENDGGVLGVTLYAFIDFAAKAVDWRSLYKSTGV